MRGEEEKVEQPGLAELGSLSPALRWPRVRGWLRDLALATIIALFIVFFVAQPVKVEGISMEPALVDQERIFINRFVYRIGEINRGDIVVFVFPHDKSKSFIKRVIGLPGETVEIRSGVVYVNGRALEEPYLDHSGWDGSSYPPIKVREGCYFVLGDHRSSSHDSRSWGLVPKENIYGRAVFRYWPITKLGILE